MNLALKYRPKTFKDVVGQKANSAILHTMIAKEELYSVLLFTGHSGVGKTTMARIVAAELNPDAKEDVHKGTHPSVMEIDGASNGSVDAMRTLKRDLNFASPGHKVIIIDEVHAISSEAKSVLLNLLEFPPANVTFILITTEVDQIPETVRHRCDHYFFKRASVVDLVERLSHVNSVEGTELSSELLNLIAQRSEGSFREALMLFEQAAVVGVKTVEQYNKLHGEVDYGPTLISSALLGPPHALDMLQSILLYSNSQEVVNRLIETFRDLMLLRGGISLSYTDKALEDRVALAKKLTADQIYKAMRIIWDLQTKLGAGDSVRNLELGITLIADLLETKAPEVPAPVVNGSAPMSLNAMKKYQA